MSPSWSHCRGIYSELIHITYSCFLVSSLDKQPGLQTNTFYLHRYIVTNDQDRRLVLLCSAHIGWSRLWILQAVMSQILCVHIFCISFMAEHTALYVFAKGHREVTAPTLHFILDDIWLPASAGRQPEMWGQLLAVTTEKEIKNRFVITPWWPERWMTKADSPALYYIPSLPIERYAYWTATN